MANSPDLLNKREKDGLPPLHQTIQQGHLNVVRYLVANGASTSVIDSNGKTPLYLAAQRGQLSALRLLQEAGVSIDQPLAESGERALQAATESGNNSVIEFLLSEGADLNAQDKEGRTSLHVAAQQFSFWGSHKRGEGHGEEGPGREGLERREYPASVWRR